jgi:hypothetical protein
LRSVRIPGVSFKRISGEVRAKLVFK